MELKPLYTGPHPLSRHLERTPVTVYGGSEQVGIAVAREIAALVRERTAKGQRTVLGLATGSTPKGVYDELIRLHREEGLSFKAVTTFNLDEWWPMGPAELQSYRRFMQEHLFDHLDIDPKQTHVPDGTTPRERVAEACLAYERAIESVGGIDIQILGIGRTGHIGFNEPGSPKDSRTRLITLDRVTRMDASSDFFGEWHVPRQAITMGVGSILAAKRVLLLALGEHKSAIVKRAVEGPITPTVAASFLQEHPGARFILDAAAAGDLTRMRTPWTLGPMGEFGLAWDETWTRRAVIWLARELKKPILKLVEEDYNEHGLQELLAVRGRAYDLNIGVFRALQQTITGWPGGRKGEATTGGDASRGSGGVFPKRVLVFSPHPDDDVISMGGTLIRLCDQGHEVHVAYQTSGNIAVWDDAAKRHADFVLECARSFKFPDASAFAERLERHVEEFVRHKKPGEPDSPELRTMKGLIRRTEARAAARYSGVPTSRIHFLDLPFYETGRVKKNPLTQADVDLMAALIQQIRPHQIYAAGDLSDPHGTHRVCLAGVFRALAKLRAAGGWGSSPGSNNEGCEVWLYRGAWQEWEPHEIEMAVPLSPDEVARKRAAIFKHESQKDRALFPGPSDAREFWQRAEDRNRATAATYDALGLAEYEAIEGFRRWQG